MSNSFPKGLFYILVAISIETAAPVRCTADCVPSPSGLVSWWRAETNGIDFVGGNSATLINGLGFAAGEVGQAFAFDGVSTHARVTASASLNVGTNSGLTVEGWINPADISSGRPIVEWNDGSNLGAHFWLCLGSATPGMFGANLVDTLGGFHVITTGADIITANTLQHIALTYDKSSGVAQLFRNGVMVAQSSLGIFTPQTSFDLFIGHRPPGGFETGTFTGLIDELSLYEHALAALEIQAIFDSGASGKCVDPTAPVFLSQPTNQSVLVGESVTLGATVLGPLPLSYRWFSFGTNVPAATNSALTIPSAQLSDTGEYFVVVTNLYGSATSSIAVLTVNPLPPCVEPPLGIVSWWRGESNALDSLGGNHGSLVGNASYAPGKAGQGFVLDGNGDGVLIGNAANLQLQDFSIEAWIKRTSPTTISFDGNGGAQIFALGGGGGGFGFYLRPDAVLAFGKLQVSEATSSVSIADTNWHHVAVTKSGTTVVFYKDGVAYPAPAYNSGGFTYSGPGYIGAWRNPSALVDNCFYGSIDELGFYGRVLASTEIQAIYAASVSGKCDVLVAPLVTSQPTNRSVLIGGSATFYASASGSLPLSYQWLFNDTNVISGATNASLLLTNVQLTDAGLYSVSITNAAGSATSSNALLTVTFPPAKVRIVGNTNAIPGSTTAIPVQLVANGDENALGFSLNYSPSLFSFSGATLGSGATNASLFYNTTQTNSGRLGLALALSSGETMAAGTQEMVVVYFNVIAVPATTNRTTSITFGDAPTTRQLVNALAVGLPAYYSNATVVIPAIDLEGDTQPRPNGNRIVTVSDWVQVGRFVARLDTVNDSSEYQRADCAPRATLGNGVLSTTDWVQAGRYAAGLDALTMAGGPTSEITNSLTGGSSIKSKHSGFSGRTVRVVSQAVQAGTTNTISVQLDSQGDENALGFSLSFDRAKLQYVGSALGSGAAGSSLNFNSDQETAGRLGAVLALGTGNTFTPGTREILKVSFLVLPSAMGNTSVSFENNPVPKEISDVTANVLASSYVNGNLAISPFPPVLRISRMDTNVIVAWPVVASNFVLQVSETISGNWSNTASPVVVGPDKVVTTPNTGTQFYRLFRP